VEQVELRTVRRGLHWEKCLHVSLAPPAVEKKMVRHRWVLDSILFLFVLALVGCDSPTAPEVNLPVTRVVQGFFSAGDASQRLVIRSQAELTAAWDAMFRTLSQPPEIPIVDFSQEMLIIARAGAKPSGGYCITVDSAVGSGRRMTVTVRSGGPSAGTILPVVTHPFDVVRVPRRDEVTFSEVSFVGNCGPLT
jgi:hypothetical protein